MAVMKEMLIEAAENYQRKHPGCTWEEACEKCKSKVEEVIYGRKDI